jgi:hypothetical protein
MFSHSIFTMAVAQATPNSKQLFSDLSIKFDGAKYTIFEWKPQFQDPKWLWVFLKVVLVRSRKRNFNHKQQIINKHTMARFSKTLQ